MIARISEGGGAAKAGLQAEDVILSLDDKPLHSAAELIQTIRQRKPGDEVKVRYRRGGKDLEAKVTLGEG